MRVAMVAVILGVSSGSERSGCRGADHAPVSVTWTIPSGPGDQGVELLGCHGWGRELQADRAELTPSWTPCSIRGWRRDGMLRVFSPPLQVDRDQESTHLAFDLPCGPIGGIGAEVRAVGSVVRIEKVLPGTPAARAGIPDGAYVTAVNGQPTASMSTTEFVRRVTGTPNTSVQLELRGPVDPGPRQTELLRERILR